MSVLFVVVPSVLSTRLVHPGCSTRFNKRLSARVRRSFLGAPFQAPRSSEVASFYKHILTPGLPNFLLLAFYSQSLLPSYKKGLSPEFYCSRSDSRPAQGAIHHVCMCVCIYIYTHTHDQMLSLLSYTGSFELLKRSLSATVVLMGKNSCWQEKPLRW